MFTRYTIKSIVDNSLNTLCYIIYENVRKNNQISRLIKNCLIDLACHLQTNDPRQLLISSCEDSVSIAVMRRLHGHGMVAS